MARSFGFLAGTDPRSNERTGAYGESDQKGVSGIGHGNGTGVYGAGNIGVHGESQNGTAAVQGHSLGSALAGRFIGNIRVEGGDVILTNGGDIAEIFEADSRTVCEPGVVMVMGDAGTLEPCSREYDKRVVGVISGAGSLRPAITLGVCERNVPTAPIALVGTVYCRVNAEANPIETGDLLTTSGHIGHATKAIDPLRSFGAIVGKALVPLSEGCGLIPILLLRQ